MLGLRFALLQPHTATWLTDGSLDWLWPAAERAGFPVALLGGDLFKAVTTIAQRHPRLKLIIDHFGRPDKAWSNLPDLVATAKFPNVAMKATGAPSYSGEAYPYRDIHGHIRKLYYAFGPERMFWARTSRACRALEAVRDDVHRRAAVLSARRQGLSGPRPLQRLGWKIDSEWGFRPPSDGRHAPDGAFLPASPRAGLRRQSRRSNVLRPYRDVHRYAELIGDLR